MATRTDGWTCRSRSSLALRLDRASGVYRTAIPTACRQTSNALPLAFGLVPASHVERVAANLAANVEAQGRHLDTGHIGIGALPFTLSDNGRADLAHAVLTRRSYPSYGQLRELGATTLWESWEPDSRGHNDPATSLPMLWLSNASWASRRWRPGGPASVWPQGLSVRYRPRALRWRPCAAGSPWRGGDSTGPSPSM